MSSVLNWCNGFRRGCGCSGHHLPLSGTAPIFLIFPNSIPHLPTLQPSLASSDPIVAGSLSLLHLVPEIMSPRQAKDTFAVCSMLLKDPFLPTAIDDQETEAGATRNSGTEVVDADSDICQRRWCVGVSTDMAEARRSRRQGHFNGSCENPRCPGIG